MAAVVVDEFPALGDALDARVAAAWGTGNAAEVLATRATYQIDVRTGCVCV